MNQHPKGSLVVVGTGITVSGQMTLISESVIKNADIVLAVVTQSAHINLQMLNPNTHCLRHHYEQGKSRVITYQKMKQRIIDEVKAGKRVVAAFYGHPGVFVNPSHKAIVELNEAGYEAEMLPGISAEDCLIADLGLDPSHYGCQSYEATQFLLRQYTIDPYMMQIIWQIGSIGDFTYNKEKAEHPGLNVLRDRLLQSYPCDHEVIVYEASTIPVAKPRIEKVLLRNLGTVIPKGISTLVVPSLGLPEFDIDVMSKLDLTPEMFNKTLSETPN
ncbi:SAM-dependent methyltransferase [Aliiglaciecola sp. M165]|uniref:SAM-dependent methyltransferase n=1 Tax=Aliiglaciecola sp. M165 TaxID=2593649 RepID=UPI00117F5A9D|nr:SAM-dependent methyltransferase [Aliiglaciecola sp. M165]TRY33143.1 methylase [Aliiglaciecola sp. M165]